MFGYPAVTHAVYAYMPYSLNSLADLLHHDVFGEQAKFMRQAANCLWILSTGKHYDSEVYRPYTENLFEETYRNPFVDYHEETGEEIIANLLKGGD